MRGIARFTSVIVLCVTSLPVRGQTPTEAAALIQPRIDEGKALLSAEKPLEAAEIFLQAAGVAPRTPKGQKARVWAGTSYATAGRIDDAITQFDLCVSQGLASAVTEQALHEKARFCADAGRREDALAAVEQLRVGYPESEFLLSALEIRGRLQGLSLEQIERVKAREREAAEILVLARDKLRIKEGRPQVLGMIEQIEQAYPETAAAIAAQTVKAEVLHIRGRIEEAQAVYQQLAKRIGAVASHSPLAAHARMRVPYEMLHRAVQLCEEAMADGVNKEDKVDAAREQCRRVLAMPECSRRMAAHARGLWVEIEVADTKQIMAEAMAEEFLRTYYTRPSDVYEYGPWVLVLHLSAAKAAAMQGKYDKALEGYEYVKRVINEMPQERRAGMQEVMKRAYFEGFLTLVALNTDRETLVTVGMEPMRLFPGPHSDYWIQKRIGLPVASQPPP